MTRPDLCGRYLAVCSEDATLQTQTADLPSLTHLSVISRSHACHLPYYANLTHFSQKSSKWAWFVDLRMRSSHFNVNVELAQEFAAAI